MYETATILEHENKKVWIKHINKNLYCVNGRFIVFDNLQDISNPEVIAYGLDMFYSPLGPVDIQLDSLIAFSIIESDNKFIMSPASLKDCMFDVSSAASVLLEYKKWKRSVDRSDLYINDFRYMSLEDWFVRVKEVNV